MACTVKLKIFFIFSQKKKSTEDFIERENALAFLHQQKLYITCTTWVRKTQRNMDGGGFRHPSPTIEKLQPYSKTTNPRVVLVQSFTQSFETYCATLYRFYHSVPRIESWNQLLSEPKHLGRNTILEIPWESHFYESTRATSGTKHLQVCFTLFV